MRPSRVSTPLLLIVLVACATEPRMDELAPIGEPAALGSVATVQLAPDRVFVQIKGVT